MCVHYNPSFHSLFYIICAVPASIVQISNPNVTFNTNASISCIAEGDFPITMVWYKGSVEIARSTTSSLTLYFSPVVRNDGGVYTCMAKDFFTSVNRSVMVLVQGKYNGKSFSLLNVCMK